MTVVYLAALVLVLAQWVQSALVMVSSKSTHLLAFHVAHALVLAQQALSLRTNLQTHVKSCVTNVTQLFYFSSSLSFENVSCTYGTRIL
jgi:hypothetical protein